jgi:hypothetical protein
MHVLSQQSTLSNSIAWHPVLFAAETRASISRCRSACPGLLGRKSIHLRAQEQQGMVRQVPMQL